MNQLTLIVECNPANRKNVISQEGKNGWNAVVADAASISRGGCCQHQSWRMLPASEPTPAASATSLWILAFEKRFMTPWFRGLLVFGLATLWWWLYASINSYNSEPVRAIYWSPRPADVYPGLIQPISAVIYTFGAATLLFWPMILGWDWSRLRILLFSFLVGTIVGFSCFLMWPLAMARPEFDGTRIGESIMRVVFAVDHPANCFPSFHAFFAIIGALFIHAYRPDHSREYVAAYLLAAAVLVTTITTGQHYFIDPFGGGLLAVLCFYLSKWLLGRKNSRAEQKLSG